MALAVLTRHFKQEENLFSFNIKYLFLVGLWPFHSLSKTQRFFYKIFEITLSILSILFIIASGIGTYQAQDDIILLLANLDKSLVAYNFFLKAIIFIIKREKLKELIEEIENSGDGVSEEQKELMAKHVIFITSLSIGIVTAFTCLALYEGEMTLEAWMPFDPMKSRMNLVIASQILAFLFIPCLCRAFAMQGLVCSVIMYLCDQLIKLQHDIKALEYSKENEMEMRKEFKKIIRKHVRLIGYSKSMEIIFKEYFLIQNLAVSVELCLNAVMMTVVGVRQMTLLITFLAYLFGALLNAYIYCYLGNELILQSEGIALAAYESSWTSWPVDMQKNLLILIIAAQRPLKLSAGGVAWLSIQTFSQALYNGYSIFAVLNDAVK